MVLLSWGSTSMPYSFLSLPSKTFVIEKGEKLNLWVRVKVEEKTIWHRKGDFLLYNMEVDLHSAEMPQWMQPPFLVFVLKWISHHRVWLSYHPFRCLCHVGLFQVASITSIINFIQAFTIHLDARKTCLQVNHCIKWFQAFMTCNTTSSIDAVDIATSLISIDVSHWINLQGLGGLFADFQRWSAAVGTRSKAATPTIIGTKPTLS